MNDRVMIKPVAFFTFILIVLAACEDKPELEVSSVKILSVYPNPALFHAYINVHAQVNESFTLRVFDPKAEIVLNENGNGEQGYPLSLEDRPSGTYHVVLEINSEVVVVKLIKL